MANELRLGVNIDHVATIRNARGGCHPDPVNAAIEAQKAGANGITAHLREDRRHIRDDDLIRLMTEIDLPLNLEMAATEEMLAIALRTMPNAVCIVPEKREEVTTEGGLDVVANLPKLQDFSEALKVNGARVSLFIDPDQAQIEAAAHIGADIVELHTGTYCECSGKDAYRELGIIQKSALFAVSQGLEVHAGHGLRYDNVQEIAAILAIKELNIGHFLIGESIFVGLSQAIQEMRQLMDGAR